MHTRYRVVLTAILTPVLLAGSTVRFPLQPTQAKGLAPAETTTEDPSQRTPEVYRGSFLQTSVATILSANGVHLYPEDRVNAFPDPSLGIGSEVRVYRAPTITINDGGTKRLIHTWAKTVDALFTEQRMELGSNDQVSLKLDAPLGNGITVGITRIEMSDLSRTESISFKTRYVDDNTLRMGTEKEEQAGQLGTLKKVFTITRENGKEVSRVLASQTTTKEPVERVVRRGTKVEQSQSGVASWYSAPSVKPMTAAHKTLPKGTKVTVTNTANGKSVVVTIADRGPYIAGRIIDLEQSAFSQIASTGAGVANVTMSW